MSLFTFGDPDLRQLNRDLERFVRDAGADYFEETKIVARGVAVSLARSTFPRGDKKGDEFEGLAAVNRDVRRVWATPGKVHEALPEDRKGPFWKAVEERNWPEATRHLEGTDFAGLPFVQTIDPALHQAKRGGTKRRVRKGVKPVAIIRDERRLTNYVKKVQKKVGMAKSAWAHGSVAVAGHARGIPAWAGCAGTSESWAGRDEEARAEAWHGDLFECRARGCESATGEREPGDPDRGAAVAEAVADGNAEIDTEV